jgi:hypothetical protein
MAKVLTPQLLRKIVLEEKAKIEKENASVKVGKLGKMKAADEGEKPKQLNGPEDYAGTVTHAKKHLEEMAALTEVEADLRDKLRKDNEQKTLVKRRIINSL